MDILSVPKMTEAGYEFVKFLNEEKTRAVFDSGKGLEIWISNAERVTYGFVFTGKIWTYEFQYGEGIA